MVAVRGDLATTANGGLAKLSLPALTQLDAALLEGLGEVLELLEVGRVVGDGGLQRARLVRVRVQRRVRLRLRGVRVRQRRAARAARARRQRRQEGARARRRPPRRRRPASA